MYGPGCTSCTDPKICFSQKDIYVRRRYWMELMKACDCEVIYNLGKLMWLLMLRQKRTRSYVSTSL